MTTRIKMKDITGLSPGHTNFLVEYTKDFAARRAAEACGYAPEHGYRLLARDDIQEALQVILARRQSAADIDAEWLMWETVDNHLIARQQGNISASNTALALLAKHKQIDAMATQMVQLDVSTDREKVERLQRGRQRINTLNNESQADLEHEMAEIEDVSLSAASPVSFF